MNSSGLGSFRKRDLGIGLLVSLLAYYLLSLASAFWTSRLEPPFVMWAVVLSALCFGFLGFVSTLRLTIPAVTAIGLILLATTSFILGSSLYDWALPLPFDFRTLLLHGGRNPLVISAAAYLIVSTMTNVLKTRKLSTRDPEPRR